MTLPLILLCIFAALLELDTTYAFQTLLSRPVIAGPIFGWLTGDVAAGIQVGIFAELLFSDISPLGGIIPPSGVVATVIPLLLYAQGIDLYFGFFLGVCAAVLYSFFDALLRKTRFKWLIFLEKRIGRRPSDITRIIAITLLLSFLMTFIFISVLAWASSQRQGFERAPKQTVPYRCGGNGQPPARPHPLGHLFFVVSHRLGPGHAFFHAGHGAETEGSHDGVRVKSLQVAVHDAGQGFGVLAVQAPQKGQHNQRKAQVLVFDVIPAGLQEKRAEKHICS